MARGIFDVIRARTVEAPDFEAVVCGRGHGLLGCLVENRREDVMRVQAELDASADHDWTEVFLRANWLARVEGFKRYDQRVICGG